MKNMTIALSITACLMVSLTRAGTLELVTIPGGTFIMGNDQEWSAPIASNLPAHEVTISTFQMSKFEITNEQYAEYLNEAEQRGEIEVRTDLPGPAGTYVVASTGQVHDGRKLYEVSGLNQADESHLNIAWIDYDSAAVLGARFSVLNSWDVYGTDEALDTATWPATFVKWNGADAFAAHYGLALPTEAQWEYAARAGGGLEYATVDGTLDLSKANYSGQDLPGDLHPDAVGHVVAVGSYPSNPYGLHDLAGNAWEWTLDFYEPDFYADSDNATDPVSFVGIDGTGVDPVESDGCTGSPNTVYDCNTRIKRGGSWNFHGNTLRNDSRNTDYVFRGNDHFGFRVVLPATAIVFIDGFEAGHLDAWSSKIK